MPLRIALLDSGVWAEHPHLAGARLQGFGLTGSELPLQRTEDYSDATGHGTAAAAALVRSIPAAELLVVRLLDEELRCSTASLAYAIEAAAAEGARLINLSLGSRRPEAEEPLKSAVDRAQSLGALCIAAAHPSGAALWPADLPTVFSATTHRGCPLADLYRVRGSLPRFVLHGYPRPVEGRNPTDNLFGTSFAAIHLTARAAEILQRDPTLDFDGVRAALESQSSGEWVVPA